MLIIGCILIIIVGCSIYIAKFTPYPFVWLLRSKKEPPREKGPETIEEIRSRIHIEKALSYPSNYPKATFDLYLPAKKPKALLVWVHGGSFIAGSSDGLRNYGAMLCDQGILVCAMNYAHAPEYAFPTQIQQLDELLTYLETDVLPKRSYQVKDVLLGGDSAGANIVASYATMRKNAALANEVKVSLHATLDLAGLLLFCGPYDFCEDMNKPGFEQFKKFFQYIGWAYLGKKNWYTREEKRLASPLQQLNDQFPPTYLCDGKKYSFLWQAKQMEEELKKRNVYVKSRFYEEMNHEFQFDYVQNKAEAMQVFEDSIAFINDIYDAKLAERK